MIHDALAAASLLLVALGVAFFAAGTLGLLRLPDLLCRLHALTKADNVGLGLVVSGLLLQVERPFDAFRLLLVWGLVLFASAMSCFLVADAATDENGRAR